MNTIHYFATENRFVAVAPGQFSETITFCQFKEDRYPLFASISFSSGGVGDLALSYYERIENGYRPSTYQEYVQARYKAQAATVEFFWEYQQFQTPPVKVDPALMQGFLAQVKK